MLSTFLNRKKMKTTGEYLIHVFHYSILSATGPTTGMYTTRHYNATGGPDTHFYSCLNPASAYQTTARVPYERDRGPQEYSRACYLISHTDGPQE